MKRNWINPQFMTMTTMTTILALFYVKTKRRRSDDISWPSVRK